MCDTVNIPTELLARLMAAIETPDDLTEAERDHVLEDASAFYPDAEVTREQLRAALSDPRPDPRTHPDYWTE